MCITIFPFPKKERRLEIFRRLCAVNKSVLVASKVLSLLLYLKELYNILFLSDSPVLEIFFNRSSVLNPTA
jgi:hypothetical protein